MGRNQERRERGQRVRGLTEFLRNHPPKFKGMCDPEGAQNWIKEHEEIFSVMVCTDVQKVDYATFMLAEEAEHWWDNTRRRLEIAGTAVSWNLFKDRFLEKYFPVGVRDKKELEFISLTQVNQTVGEYAARFRELARFCSSYATADSDRLRCDKFKRGLRFEIKHGVAALEVQDFATLVHECMEFEDTSYEEVDYFRNKKSVLQGKGKQPLAPSGKGFKYVGITRFGFPACKLSGRSSYTPRPARCGKCGEGHYTNECKKTEVLCFKCRKPGHISRDCGKAKSGSASDGKSQKPQANRLRSSGRVLALSETGVSGTEDLNQGTCFIQGIPLSVLMFPMQLVSFLAYIVWKRCGCLFLVCSEFICDCSYG